MEANSIERWPECACFPSFLKPSYKQLLWVQLGRGCGGWLSLDSELRPKRLFSYALHLSEYLPLQPQRALCLSPLIDWSFHSFVGLCAHSGMFVSTSWVTPFMSSPMSFLPYPSFSYFPLYCVVLSMSDRQGKMVFNIHFSLDRLENRLGEGGSGVWVYDRPEEDSAAAWCKYD